MLQKKKIIAFDLDDTLTPSKTLIDEEMVGLLSELAKGYMVSVISGGSFTQFQKQLEPLFTMEREIRKQFIFLPTTGSQIYQYNSATDSFELTHEQKLPEEEKKKIVVTLQKVIDNPDFNIPNSPAGDYVEDRGTQITFSALGQNAELSDKRIWDPDHAKRAKIKKVLEEELPLIAITVAGTTSIDLLPKGFSKGTALLTLLNYLTLSKEDLLFVGDALFPGGNDYAVFEAGILTVSVENSEDTKKWIREFLS